MRFSFLICIIFLTLKHILVDIHEVFVVHGRVVHVKYTKIGLARPYSSSDDDYQSNLFLPE